MNIFGLGTTELVIILVVILILFGPKRLPQLGKSIGKTMKAIREGVEGKSAEDEDAEAAPAAKVNAEAKKVATADDADAEEEE